MTLGPRKKKTGTTTFHGIESSWWFKIGICIVVFWNNPYNWVGFYPLIYPQRPGFFHCSPDCQGVKIGTRQTPIRLEWVAGFLGNIVRGHSMNLVVSTPLKNICPNGNLPQVGVKIKNIWNHHLVYQPKLPALLFTGNQSKFTIDFLVFDSGLQVGRNKRPRDPWRWMHPFIQKNTCLFGCWSQLCWCVSFDFQGRNKKLPKKKLLVFGKSESWSLRC